MNTSIEIPEELRKLAVQAALPRNVVFASADYKIDMRTALAKRLCKAAHSHHVVSRYERRSRKYGSYRSFVSFSVAQLYDRLRQEDSELEDAVIDLVAATRKITA